MLKVLHSLARLCELHWDHSILLVVQHHIPTPGLWNIQDYIKMVSPHHTEIWIFWYIQMVWILHVDAAFIIIIIILEARFLVESEFSFPMWWQHSLHAIDLSSPCLPVFLFLLSPYPPKESLELIIAQFMCKAVTFYTTHLILLLRKESNCSIISETFAPWVRRKPQIDRDGIHRVTKQCVCEYSVVYLERFFLKSNEVFTCVSDMQGYTIRKNNNGLQSRARVGTRHFRHMW